MYAADAAESADSSDNDNDNDSGKDSESDIKVGVLLGVLAAVAFISVFIAFGWVYFLMKHAKVIIPVAVVMNILLYIVGFIVLGTVVGEWIIAAFAFGIPGTVYFFFFFFLNFYTCAIVHFRCENLQPFL